MPTIVKHFTAISYLYTSVKEINVAEQDNIDKMSKEMIRIQAKPSENHHTSMEVLGIVKL